MAVTEGSVLNDLRRGRKLSQEMEHRPRAPLTPGAQAVHDYPYRVMSGDVAMSGLRTYQRMFQEHDPALMGEMFPGAGLVIKGVDPALDALRRGLSRFPRAPQASLTPDNTITYGTSASGVAPGSAYTMQHYGPGARADRLLAGRYGTRGSAMGSGGEGNRLTGPEAEDIRPRVFGYGAGQKPETHIAAGQPMVEVTVPGMYNMRDDPENLRRTIREYLGDVNRDVAYGFGPQREDIVSNMVERELKERGYRGYYQEHPQLGRTAVVFEDIDLRAGGLNTEQSAQQIRESLGSPPLRVDEAKLGEASGVGLGAREKSLPRNKKTGQYTGLPKGVDTPSKLGAITRGIRAAAERGQAARNWYEGDSVFLHGMMSGDVNRQLDLTTGLSVTSPRTKVEGNAAEGLRSVYQNLTDRPIQAGRYPGEMGETLEAAFLDPLIALGRKRASFRNDLMGQYIPEAPRGSTQDMWMARLGGFPTDALGSRQYTSMENLTHRVTNQLNRERQPLQAPWTDNQVQSSGWTDIKSRTEGTPIDVAGGSFRTAYEKMGAIMPTETVPGANISPNSVLGKPGPRELYFDDVQRMMKDPYGNNVVDQQIGLASLPTFRGQGVWHETVDGERLVQYNPVMADRPVAPEVAGRDANREKVRLGLGDIIMKTEKDPETGALKEVETFVERKGLSREENYLKHRLNAQVDRSARDLLDASTITKGILLDQQAATWVRPIDKSGAPKYTRNAVKISAPPMDKTELRRIGNDLDKWKTRYGFAEDDPLPVVPTDDGFMVYRPVAEDLTVDGARESLAGIEKFQTMMRDYIDQRIGKWREYGYRPEVKWLQADSNYFFGANEYKARFAQLPESVQERAQKALSIIRPHIAEHQKWYQESYR